METLLSKKSLKRSYVCGLDRKVLIRIKQCRSNPRSSCSSFSFLWEATFGTPDRAQVTVDRVMCGCEFKENVVFV